MDREALVRLLEGVQAGEVPVEAACERLSQLPYADLGIAKVDCHRAVRTGFPEVVFGEGKTYEQLEPILDRLLADHERVLATRVRPEDGRRLVIRFPELTHHEAARCLSRGHRPMASDEAPVALLCAGTSDLPVAEEAALTCELRGIAVRRYVDVGVAGLHRLLAQLEPLRRARVLVVVAGMEGALPGVAAGLVGRPVIAVPTSVGYGANFGGLSALLTMLNTCASGVAVVNIDNGFGAGTLAAMIVQGEHDRREASMVPPEATR